MRSVETYQFVLARVIDMDNEVEFRKQDDFVQLDERLYQHHQNARKIYLKTIELC